jgi:hypothetical protein
MLCRSGHQDPHQKGWWQARGQGRRRRVDLFVSVCEANIFLAIKKRGERREVVRAAYCSQTRLLNKKVRPPLLLNIDVASPSICRALSPYMTGPTSGRQTSTSMDTNATISPRSGADRACTSARLASLVTNQSSTVILLIRSEPYVPDSSHTATLESAHMELARVRLSHEKALAGTQLDGLFDTLV